jgi:hypothetical protein
MENISRMFTQPCQTCCFSFSETCFNGHNELIWSFTNDISYISYNIQPANTTFSNIWTDLSCAQISALYGTPLVNSGLHQGDMIHVKGICGVQIIPTQDPCGFVSFPACTNIYCFYDVTSMEYSDAKVFRDAIENWASSANGPGGGAGGYQGNIYHLPVNHERWVLWPQYPITGILPPYYQLSPCSPADDWQWNSLANETVGTPATVTEGGQTSTPPYHPIELCKVGAGCGPNIGPDDENGYHYRRPPWKGPLVTSDQTGNYDALHNTVHGNAQYPGAPTFLRLDDAQDQRDEWDFATDGTTIFFNLPKDGDVICNYNGTGLPKVIGYDSYTIDANQNVLPAGNYIPGECADLSDLRTGDWDGTSNNGTSTHYDAGGSQANFIGGDYDSLVVCLSDETVQGSFNNTKSVNTMIQGLPVHNRSGNEQGYHGYLEGGGCDLDYFESQPPAANEWINDPTNNINRAKRHYWLQASTTCHLFPSYHFPNSGPNVDKWGCDHLTGILPYSSNRTSVNTGSIGAQGTSWTVGRGRCGMRGCPEENQTFPLLAYDWNKGVLGAFLGGHPATPMPLPTALPGAGQGTVSCGNYKNLTPTMANDPNDLFPGSDFFNSSWSDPNATWKTKNTAGKLAHVEPMCGYPHCNPVKTAAGNSESPYSDGCNFDILTMPTPGYIADYRYHLENIVPLIKNMDNKPNAAQGVGALFSTFFYCVTRDASSKGIKQNPLTHAAALEGTTVNPLPSVVSGISVKAIEYFNPYGQLDHWHPNDTMGWDPNLAPDWIPNTFGLKHYMKGFAGKSGYNLSRATWNAQAVDDDLTAFVSSGGTVCPGNDCLTFKTVDVNGQAVPNVSFDFNNTTITTDAIGESSTTVPAGIYDFLCNTLSINTSPSILNNHTDPIMATNPPTQGHTGTFGCNSWDIILTVIEDDYTLVENCKPGCTDGTGQFNPTGVSAACNFDPTAGVDDGSCVYADCTDMCDDPNDSTPYIPSPQMVFNGISYPGLDTYPNDVTNFPFAWEVGGGDAYWSIQCPNCCVGGNTGLLPSDCVDCLGICGGNAVYDECGVCDGPGPDICGICFGDGTCCVGCIDPLAINFDPNATVACDPDCCEYPDIECKLRELAVRLLETCEKDCCDTTKEMLLEATMLYTSLFMISGDCDIIASSNVLTNQPVINKSKIHSLIQGLERLLVKIECGVCCRNC